MLIFASWIWFSAYGWLYKLWDMLFLFWSGFCMAESWARKLSFCLACKPFPGVCVAGDASQLWQLGLCLCSLTEQTGAARSTNLDSWCATRVSKTLDVVHRYGLLVSNSSMHAVALLHALSNEAGAGQFMTDFLPFTAWSQVPPVSLSVSLCA